MEKTRYYKETMLPEAWALWESLWNTFYVNQYEDETAADPQPMPIKKEKKKAKKAPAKTIRYVEKFSGPAHHLQAIEE